MIRLNIERGRVRAAVVTCDSRDCFETAFVALSSRTYDDLDVLRERGWITLGGFRDRIACPKHTEPRFT